MTRAPIRFLVITRNNTTCERIPLDAQGYDRHGKYWGLAHPLYELHPKNPAEREFSNGVGHHCIYMRAENAREARKLAHIQGFRLVLCDRGATR